MINHIGQGEQIRYFERIMRNANAHYPRISPYRIQMLNDNLPEKHEAWLDRVAEKLDMHRLSARFKTLKDVIKSYVFNLKRERIGNCGESAALSVAALLANGHNDYRIGRLLIEATARSLETEQKLDCMVFDTTHEFVILNLAENANPANPKTYGKNVIIMDAWNGFCANLNESFKNFFDIFMNGTYKYTDNAHNAEISYKPLFKIIDLGVNDEQAIQEFKMTFPELIIKSKNT